VKACVCGSSQSAGSFKEDSGEVGVRCDAIEPEGFSLLLFLRVVRLLVLDEFNVGLRVLDSDLWILLQFD